ncbi:MAG TPA: addiction module protein [Fimbriiglobus sp.]|jgi:hypothetical protein
MTALLNQLGIDKLSVADRLTLIDQIWESLDAEDGTFVVPPPSELELVIEGTAADLSRSQPVSYPSCNPHSQSNGFS